MELKIMALYKANYAEIVLIILQLFAEKFSIRRGTNPLRVVLYDILIRHNIPIDLCMNILLIILLDKELTNLKNILETNTL